MFVVNFAWLVRSCLQMKNHNLVFVHRIPVKSQVSKLNRQDTSRCIFYTCLVAHMQLYRTAWFIVSCDFSCYVCPYIISYLTANNLVRPGILLCHSHEVSRTLQWQSHRGIIFAEFNNRASQMSPRI